MKKIFWSTLTLINYMVCMMSFFGSMRNNDTYLIGLAIFNLMVASRMEKRLEEVEEGND